MSPRKRGRGPGRSLPEDDVPDETWRPGERRVLLAESCFFGENRPAEIIYLRHPRTKASAAFLVDGKRSMMRELITFTEPNRCWFIDDYIESKGSVYMATEFDPIFVILPYLRRAKKLEPISQLLKDEDFPALGVIAESSDFLANLSSIADSKGGSDLKVWKYNEDKTLTFLAEKTHRLKDALVEKGVNIHGGEMSVNYVKSLKADTSNDAQILRYAHGIVSDYLEDDLSRQLAEHMHLPIVETDDASGKKKRRENDIETVASKKARTTMTSIADEPLEDYSKDYKKQSKTDVLLNAKQRALARNASGTKSITSFFSKK